MINRLRTGELSAVFPQSVEQTKYSRFFKNPKSKLKSMYTDIIDKLDIEGKDRLQSRYWNDWR